MLDLFSVIRGKFCSELGLQFHVKCGWVCKVLLKIVCDVFVGRDWNSKISDFKLFYLMPLSQRWSETTKIAFTTPTFENKNKLEMERLDLALKISKFCSRYSLLL